MEKSLVKKLLKGDFRIKTEILKDRAEYNNFSVEEIEDAKSICTKINIISNDCYDSINAWFKERWNRRIQDADDEYMHYCTSDMKALIAEIEDAGYEEELHEEILSAARAAQQ